MQVVSQQPIFLTFFPKGRNYQKFFVIVLQPAFVDSSKRVACFLQISLKLYLPMHFEIIGKIHSIETIAVGTSIRDIKRLRKHYGSGRWRKMKGVAKVRLRNGRIRTAELHWYEAHGIGKKEFKRKRYLD